MQQTNYSLSVLENLANGTEIHSMISEGKLVDALPLEVQTEVEKQIDFCK